MARYSGSLCASAFASSFKIAIAARLAAMNSFSQSLLSNLTGQGHFAFAKKLAFPGQYITLNFHILMRCLIWNRHALATWSMLFCPSSPLRGL